MRLDTQVLALDRTTLATPAGAIRARAVLIAADPPAAARLLGIPSPTMRALTTYYHRTNQAPTNRRLLHLDGDRDGGPVINTAVVSNVAPRYAPPGIALIASTVLGVTDDALESPVRGHAARIYGVDPQHWEHVATYPISATLPAMPAGQALRQPVDLGDGIFVAGDHRDTPSIQGALASGHRAGQAIRGYLHGTRRS